MAPTRQKVKNTKVSGKDVHFNKAKLPTAAVKKKRKWIPEHKFKGSVKEGRGFAFDKKQKVRHEYNKLLRKERKKQTTESKVLYKEEYPEHLKHLYLAEEEKLRNEAWTNRMNRSKLRIKGQLKDKQSAAVDDDDEEEEEEFIGGSEQMDSVSENPKPMMALEKESLPISNRMKKKMEKKTSYQRTKEEFERVRENQRKKKEVKCCLFLLSYQIVIMALFFVLNSLFICILIPGVPEEQTAERRSPAEIQAEKIRDVSNAEQKD
uniref:Coiled-coil domain containing 59 n=1 Tax=Nothobranchius furzeri TaxID=105023 RepID=A0A8C6NJ91_NOTFU